MNDETVVASVEADTSDFEAKMEEIKLASEEFGRVFVSTMSDAIASGKDFESTLRSIGRRLIDLALNQALAPLEGTIASLAEGVALAFAGTIVPQAKGGIFQPSGMVPFSRGGVVSAPTAFAFSKQLGVMGEAGPEAIMPLKRGSDGKLGVAAPVTSSSQSIIFNVQATDAASFRKSESQITTMLARAVARGQRGL